MAREVYKYSWEIVFRIPNRKIAFAPFSLVRFVKTCNYIDNTIPSYEMIVKISDPYLNVFRMYDKEITVDIKQKMQWGRTRNEYNNEKVIFEDSFVPFYDKNTIPMYNSAIKTVKGDPNVVGSDYKVDDAPGINNPQEIRFMLLSKKDLAMRKIIHNYVLGTSEVPVNPASAVSFLIQNNDYIKKFLMDEPENTNRYSDMIIKPADIINAIHQIQTFYGIYTKDVMTFYDSGMLYILNKYGSEHVHQENEVDLVNIKIDEQSNVINPTDDAVISVEKKIISYRRVSGITKADNETVLGELVGDRFVYSNFDSVINSVFGDEGKTEFLSPLHTVDRDIQTHIGTGIKKIMDYDMLNNPYNMSSYIARTTVGVPISFTLTAINCEHFSPNKRIKLRLDTQESEKLYSGTYNIASATFIYNTTESPHSKFDTFGHVLLTLFNKNDGYDKDYEVKE